MRVGQLCRRFLPKQACGHLRYFLIDPAEVPGKHHLFFVLVFKAILLGQWRIVLLLFLDMPHIKVRFTEELGCFELVCFFKVHALHGLGLGRREITSRLTTDPASSHIRNLRGRHQAIHFLIERGRDTLIVDADALCGLLYLTKDVILQPFQRFLVSRRAAKDVATDRNDLGFKNLK